MAESKNKWLLTLPLPIGGGIVLLWDLYTLPGAWGPVLIGASVLWIVLVGAFILVRAARRLRSERDTLLEEVSALKAARPASPEGAELEDASFLSKVLDEGMPPAFVKRWDPDRNEGDHIFENGAFKRIQDAAKTVGVAEDRRTVIHADHHRGDLAALNEGRSVQLEISDRRTGETERVILTTKTRVVHGGTTYIVGWFVPVGLRGSTVTAADVGDVVCLREDRLQVVFRLASASGDARQEVPVGEAVKTRATAK
ncbi:MAG TPA: hypothetical protein VG318_06240 [Actinomycetota bacterium]|nr:hypothetical protein [Actinomycetota bacterium]